MALMMRGASLARYPEVAANLGLDPRAILRRLGIDSRIFEEPEHRIPAAKVVELLNVSAEESGCETFGLRMALARQLSDYGPISLLLTHQPTVGDALATLVRFHRMLNEALVLELEDFPDGLVVAREVLLGGDERPLRQAYELAVGTLISIFRGPHGPVVNARSVHFTHGPPEDLAVHRRLFGPDIEFNSDFNGFTTTRSDLDRPNPVAEATLAGHAERLVQMLPYSEPASTVVDVRKAINTLLAFNGASMATVSARLGVSARTLQRRLAEEGAEFSLLLNEVRREHALRYIDNARLPLAQVAGLVGYSHETSFARWFTNEFGLPPSARRAAPP